MDTQSYHTTQQRFISIKNRPLSLHKNNQHIKNIGNKKIKSTGYKRI